MNKDICRNVSNYITNNSAHNSLESTQVFNVFTLLQREDMDDDVDLNVDVDEDEDEYEEYIWGVGFPSMIGKSWADVCDV